jgi:hypothetical protein
MKLLKAVEDFRFGKTEWQMRRKARSWQAKCPARSPSDSPIVIFAMPLVSKRRAKDWEVVQTQLNQTLASFQRQSSDNWQVVIAGQDRPHLPDDPRIQFIKANVSDKFYDKGDKRRILIDHIAKSLKADAYYMQFDADDILHPDFVQYVQSDNNARGYVITDGYIVSLTEQAVITKPKFDQSCGSCAAVYVDFRQNHHDAKLLIEHRSHTKITALCADFGQPLAPVPFASALYIVGHGQNMIERRGKLEQRTQNWVQGAVSDQDAQSILETFQATDLDGWQS